MTTPDHTPGLDDLIERVARIIDPGAWETHDQIAARPDDAEWLESWKAGSVASGGRWALSLERARAALTSANVEALVEALREIRDRDWVENCLDSQWAAHRAAAALANTKDNSNG